MKRYYCCCGNEIYFENTLCHVCKGALGFIPELLSLVRMEQSGAYRPCQHRTLLNCNWLVNDTDSNPQCVACRLTRTIPDLGVNNNLSRWTKLEATKRRAFYMLLNLQLPIPNRGGGGQVLLFDFLEDKRSNRFSELDMVYTGHASGVITLNAAEANDSYRSAAQDKMQEAYRTLLGHFRHELGHYYWLLYQYHNADVNDFRALFGDERQDYSGALKHFYRQGPRSDWPENYISAYASSHPLEDWAECWAHYLHIRETLETAAAFGLIDADPATDSFSDCLAVWMRFSVILNALNRSMGFSDPYPFAINAIAERKLHFIDNWLQTLVRRQKIQHDYPAYR
ncbi:MAG: putative zinc-binding metallopeptidase [Methylomonas sp.]